MGSRRWTRVYFNLARSLEHCRVSIPNDQWGRGSNEQSSVWRRGEYTDKWFRDNRLKTILQGPEPHCEKSRNVRVLFKQSSVYSEFVPCLWFSCSLGLLGEVALIIKVAKQSDQAESVGKHHSIHWVWEVAVGDEVDRRMNGHNEELQLRGQTQGALTQIQWVIYIKRS